MGGACQLLTMQHAGKIFSEIEVLLLTIHRSNLHPDEEIQEKCKAYVEALEQFDALALPQIPSGMATPADIAAAQQATHQQHATLAMAC